MENDKDNMQKSIDDLTEWQENQYNPGHWIGGITPNNLLTPRKPKILGISIIFFALICFMGFGFVLKNYLGESMSLLAIEHFYYIAQLVLLGGFSILMLVGGILKIKK